MTSQKLQASLWGDENEGGYEYNGRGGFEQDSLVSTATLDARASIKECDDEAIRSGKVFVDKEAALVEAGELVGAFDRGVIKKDEIGGHLVELVRDDKVGRNSSEQIVVFKSVGSVVVDMLAAQFVFETYTRS
ncbi:Ornithine cyclodeaminase/mu-crystallin [Sesbania bispinosa]|nr:Ornithine cyclodeaminase/mu-crystallin [Sesbania bispinosa]